MVEEAFNLMIKSLINMSKKLQAHGIGKDIQGPRKL
jgi:hypothetical protein